MTIKQIVQNFRKAREQDVVEKAREVLQDVPGEASIYRPTDRWKEILSSFGLSEMENKVACVTYYAVDDSIFAKVKRALKQRYKVVEGTPADDLGYRQIFACGQSADAEPSILLCINFYEESRASVKAQFREEDLAHTDATDADDLEELEL